VSLPRFFDRVATSALPLLPAAGREALTSRLEATTLALAFRGNADLNAGFMLAVNLAARLYPQLVIEAPDELAAEATTLAQAINPNVDFGGKTTHRLSFADAPAESDTVTVFATGWNIVVDGARNGTEPAAPPAALAAGALGIGMIFRAVFADWLERGRTEREPGSFNLITLSEWSDPPVPERFAVGRVHLAGAGAVGEAAILTLGSATVEGELVVVDPDTVELSNLQRYVLTRDSDEGVAKPALAKRELEKSTLNVVEVTTPWGRDERSAPGQETVLTALDSGSDRIGLQAGLHRRVYNAYTQPTDIGWSRHEAFGIQPCLACLYWPRGSRPHQYQLVAGALEQPALRIRAYLASNRAVGQPLAPPLQLPQTPSPPTPEEVIHWLTTPLLTDIAPRYGLDTETQQLWSTKTLDQLYRKGICGGGLVRVDGVEDAVLVPLAHQSALAGVMLATQLLIASDEELRTARPHETEGRLDLRRRLPISLTSEATKRDGCLCSDNDFLAASAARWG
jgi:hypothetical protein